MNSYSVKLIEYLTVPRHLCHNPVNVQQPDCKHHAHVHSLLLPWRQKLKNKKEVSSTAVSMGCYAMFPPKKQLLTSKPHSFPTVFIKTTTTTDCYSVVYKFQCDLCDTNYVGYTTRHLHQRIGEHKHSAIGRNLVDHGLSKSDLKDKQLSVLRKCRSKFDFLIFEMFIKELKSGLNTQDSVRAKLFT